MWLEGITGVWCAAGLAWACVVWALSSRRPATGAPAFGGGTPPRLHLFKPIPPAAAADPSLLGHALESFAAQLRAGDTLWIGLPAAHPEGWDSLISGWRQRFPDAAARIIHLETPPEGLNPKVDKLRQMASGVPEGFWVWSDADITAPAGYLDRVREELARHPDSLVTGCYLIGALSRPSDLADAVVINLQLNPGMKILARLNQLRGAMGALCAFDSAMFHKRCSFEHLAACLADDYELGRALSPVRLVETPALHTPAVGPGWAGALAHALRWQRTIHWCDPLGAALQVAIHPLIGLAAALALRPSWGFLCALLGWIFLETLWAGLVFRRQGIRIHASARWVLPVTGLLRTGLWLWAWLPRGVRWDRKTWTAPVNDGKPRRSWRTLLAGAAPWAAWWGLAPLDDPRARALGALAAWWITQGLEKLELKAVDSVFAVFFTLQLLHPFPAWGLELNALLLAMAAGSLILRRPFTLGYAREETDPGVWDHPEFLRANYIIAIVWTLAFAFNFTWLAAGPFPIPVPAWLPLTASLAAAGLFTKFFPGWYRHRMGMDGPGNGEPQA